MKNNNSVDGIHKEIIINDDTGKYYLINNNNEDIESFILLIKIFSGFKSQ